MDLVPGGYYFIHFVFWTVAAMVAVGTTIVANISVTRSWKLAAAQTFLSKSSNSLAPTGAALLPAGEAGVALIRTPATA